MVILKEDNTFNALCNLRSVFTDIHKQSISWECILSFNLGIICACIWNFRPQFLQNFSMMIWGLFSNETNPVENQDFSLITDYLVQKLHKLFACHIYFLMNLFIN